ncbi:MAG TPA: EamA family transporter [Verrucomicrobiae bacterium]|nr:EamA family transporter [Verrucomicrobiae bacterium]
MARLLTILFIALCFEPTGVIMLKRGLTVLEGPKNYWPAELGKLVARVVTNKFIVLGVAFEAVFFLGLLMMMSRGEVSFVWPLTSLTFVFSTVAARFYLREEVDTLRWAGVMLIVCGAGLITYTEKKKETAVPAATVQTTPSSQK